MPTNPYYQDQFSGQAGQLAQAEQVDSEFQGVQAGFDSVSTDVQSAVRDPDKVALTLANVAGRTNKWFRFDAVGQPQMMDSPLNPRGAWAPNTTYFVGDAYTAPPNNSLYYVKTQYTSGSTIGGIDVTNTLRIVDLSGLFFANYQLVTGPATVTAASGGSYLCDSTGGDITINLPSAALGASPVNVTHCGGSLAAGHALSIVSASGQFIMGNTENTLNVDVANASMSLAYGGVPYGWRLRVMG